MLVIGIFIAYEIFPKNKIQEEYQDQLTMEIEEAIKHVTFSVEGEVYKLFFEGFQKSFKVEENEKNNTKRVSVNLSVYKFNKGNDLQHITTYTDFIFIRKNQNSRVVLENRKDLGTIMARLHLGFVREYYEHFLKVSNAKEVQGHGKYQEDTIVIDREGNIVNNEYVDYTYTVKAFGKEDEIIQEVTFKSRFRIQDTEIEVDVIK